MPNILVMDDGALVCGSVHVNPSTLRHLAYRISPEYAEDLVQAMYADILERPRLADPTPARLRTRCVWAARNHLRRDLRHARGRTDLVEIEATPAETDEHVDEAEYTRRLALICEQVAAIKSEQARRVAYAMLRPEYGGSQTEVAKALGLNPRTVSQHYATVKAHLKLQQELLCQ